MIIIKTTEPPPPNKWTNKKANRDKAVQQSRAGLLRLLPRTLSLSDLEVPRWESPAGFKHPACPPSACYGFCVTFGQKFLCVHNWKKEGSPSTLCWSCTQCLGMPPSLFPLLLLAPCSIRGWDLCALLSQMMFGRTNISWETSSMEVWDAWGEAGMRLCNDSFVPPPGIEQSGEDPTALLETSLQHQG